VIKREQARNKRDALADLESQLDDEDPASPLARVKREQTKARVAELRADLDRMPEPYTETEMMDAAADMFGHVLLRVDIGDASHTYPSDHTERLDFLKDLPFMAVAQLAHAIRSQQYRVESLGK